MSKNVDMLNGPTLKKIIVFALPIIAMSILQQLFNSADVAVVGHYCGNRALAAVGSNAPVINTLINIFVGLSLGANVVISTLIGQNKKHEIPKAIHTAMTVAAISGIFLIALGMLITKKILLLVNTPSDVIDYATIYLRLYFLGMPFIMIYNFSSAILRSKGDTQRPMYILIASGIINVLLNLLFVIVFKMGVRGVGIATLISNAISGLLTLYLLLKEKDDFKLNLMKLHIDFKHLKRIVQIGLPAGLQGLVFSISNMCILRGLNSFGSDAVAGSSAALNFEMYSYFIICGFNQSCTSFISQNYGAKQFDRCKRIMKECLLCAFIGALVLSQTWVWARDLLCRIYTKNEIALDYAKKRVFTVEMLGALVATYEVLSSALRGIGWSTVPTAIVLFGTCVIRITWINTAFKMVHTYENLLIVYPVSWTISAILMAVAWIIISKKYLNVKQPLPVQTKSISDKPSEA